MSTRRERAKAQSAQLSRDVTMVVASPEKLHPVAKKFIGGVILAGLMKQDINYLILALVGGVVVTLFLLFGIWLINYANRSK